MITAEEFVKSITLNDGGSNVTKLATVVSLFASGKPKLKFDGEDVASEKEYEILGSYSPKNGDRVLLLGASGTWVILGSLGIQVNNTLELFKLEGDLIKTDYRLGVNNDLYCNSFHHKGNYLSFFNKWENVEKRSVRTISQSSNLVTTIDKLNEVITDLKAYNLL